MSDAYSNAPRALAVPRPSSNAQSDLAEVIDLVQLPIGARPTPYAHVDWEEVPRLRVLGCESYHRCLSFVAQVRWKSFHCRQCPRSPERTGEAHLAEGALADLGD